MRLSSPSSCHGGPQSRGHGSTFPYGPPAVALGQCPLVGPGPMHRRHLLLPARVPKPDLSEARSLLLFAVALAAAAALGCTGLVACADHLAPVWRHPGAAFAP
ncbi:myotonin-protein kinase-like [Leptonychotes weddellii]|uniref:Myotonin-protein kinase-like n=1 Tax=Leptonychotes weddellii TaxID=9713 RepID=A0A7F8R860_LEPWE|nr:myotonin-protein kinase-like [Leptonychotes weddellii]